MGIEIIITGVSFIITAIIRMMVAKRESDQETMRMALQAHKQESEERVELAKIGGGFAFTRRIIALFIVGAVIGMPLISPIFFDVVISNCVPDTSEVSGFWGLFSWDTQVLVCKETQGIEITPFHTNLVGVILGFYFGNKVGK